MWVFKKTAEEKFPTGSKYSSELDAHDPEATHKVRTCDALSPYALSATSQTTLLFLEALVVLISRKLHLLHTAEDCSVGAASVCRSES